MKAFSSIKYIGLLFILQAFLWQSCEVVEPLEDRRIGDTLTFSGYQWEVKHSESAGELLFPGPNVYSNHRKDVWVDPSGNLHLAIRQRNSIWYATEVIGLDTTSYGTYTWTVIGDLKNIPTNVVLGLFSYDPSTFQTDGYSEIDIELSYFGNDSIPSPLLYTVQPTNLNRDASTNGNDERLNYPDIDSTKVNILVGKTTHEFRWYPDSVVWKSYAGGADKNGELLAEWSFQRAGNRPRVRTEGTRRSNPIIIPSPGPNTSPRMNLWIASWLEPMPTDGMEREIVIESFTYEPLP